MNLRLTQLGALVWLKWRLLRNALRTRRGAANRVASLVLTLILLVFGLGGAVKIAFVVYALSAETSAAHTLRAQAAAAGVHLTLLFVLFGSMAFIYLLWATVPLSLGGGGQFTPGRLLLYPVSLPQLFVLDLLSELTSTASVFAVPAVVAMALGAGLARGRVAAALVVAAGACAFGLALAKLLATSVGTLMQTRRSRGEMLLAGLGALGALAGVLMGQSAQVFARQKTFPPALLWTPPGAYASALTDGLRAGDADAYLNALVVLFVCTLLALAITYNLARRAALGLGGGSTGRATKQTKAGTRLMGELPGWEWPFVAPELATVVMKELRYAARNAQLRVMGLMPVIMTLAFKFSNPRGRAGLGGLFASPYFDGVRAATSIFYVFMITSALFCNQFGFDGAGWRTIILAPVARRTILVGKNIALLIVALLFAVVVTAFNEIMFRDLSLRALLFAALSFLLFAAEFTTVGNYLSIHFPKRLEFGRRMNTSGLTSLLILPLLLLVFVPPTLAILAGYYERSLTVEYVILALFAGSGVSAYLLLLNRQARTLMRRELDILEAVTVRDE